MIRKTFAPGCALMIYKPEMANKVYNILKSLFGEMDMLLTCCKQNPEFKENTQVINICPGCDKRFKNDYPNTSTISLWEVLAKNGQIKLPDYKGKTMTILDACPTRNNENVQNSIRKLLERMNINILEPEQTKAKSICCGDSFYGTIPVEKVKLQMKKRADQMPVDDVVVYCISCIKSMHIGNKNPFYLVALLLGENTEIQTFEPDDWHKQVDDYIALHSVVGTN